MPTLQYTVRQETLNYLTNCKKFLFAPVFVLFVSFVVIIRWLRVAREDV